MVVQADIRHDGGHYAAKFIECRGLEQQVGQAPCLLEVLEDGHHPDAERILDQTIPQEGPWEAPDGATAIRLCGRAGCQTTCVVQLRYHHLESTPLVQKSNR